MYVRYVLKNKLGEKIICIKMRRTQEYLHKYPRDVRIGVLESLVQRAPLDNPRDQAERHLGWDWIAGRNQKSLGMAKGRDNQSRDPRFLPRGRRKRLSGTGQLGLGPYNAHSCQLSKISFFPSSTRAPLYVSPLEFS